MNLKKWDDPGFFISLLDSGVQLRSNLAYDKLARYLDELENKKTIDQSPTFGN